MIVTAARARIRTLSSFSLQKQKTKKQAMESQVEAGRAKAIGLSNFNSHQIERIVQTSRIKPANLQVEMHAYFQQKRLRAYCKKHDIVICAYGPLGSKGRVDFSARFGIP